MRIVPNYKDLERIKRLSSNKVLSYRNVLNSGSPTSQSLAAPLTPSPTPPVPTNQIYTIAGDSLKTIAGTNIYTIS